MSFLELVSVTRQDWERLLDRSLYGLPQTLRRCWQRALSMDVDPQGGQDELIATSRSLRERQEALEPIFAALSERLEPWAGTLSSQHFRLLFADADGMILKTWGGGDFEEEAEKVRLIQGSLWSESLRGTNAIGTAIAERCAVAVHGAAHYLRPNHSLVCYAAPIFDEKGELLGILDATSFAGAAHPSVMAAILTAAKSLEEKILWHQTSPQRRLRLEVLQRFLEHYPSPGFLVMPNGQIRMANRAAIALLPTLLGKEGEQRVLLFEKDTTPNLSLPPTIQGVSWSKLAASTRSTHELELPSGQSFRLQVEALFEDENTPFLVLFDRISRTQTSVTSKKHEAFDTLLGDDPTQHQVLFRATQLARTKLPLLLCSETGTGKDLLARAIHRASPRAEKPFVALNCATFSGEMLASELFGYAPYAFTGASPQGKKGHIAHADGGTLFLDEIAEASPACQAMLLRLLEDGSYYRVGETQLQKVDVRVICATCRDLEEEMNQGRFRRDLYFRVRGSSLRLPPVRERLDLSVLVTGLIEQLAEEMAWEDVPTLSTAASEILGHYDWPGNVRELRHMLHCAMALAYPASFLDVEHLEASLPGVVSETPPLALEGATEGTMEASKLTMIQRVLEQTKGNVSAAARILGVARSTIYRMLQRHDSQ